MIKHKIMALAYLMIAMTGTLQAQTEKGANSPYTRYGFGALSDQHFGNSKAMGGIAYGLRNGLQINATNPASYTAIDSLTFILDAGFSLQNCNFKEGSEKINAKNSSIDYIAMQFRFSKRLSFSAGFLPYSSVGYQMNQTETLNQKDEYGQDIYVQSNYMGTGGLNQIYAGLGFKVLKNLSIGANISYLYGDISHVSTKTFNDPSADKSVKSENISIDDYKLDAGIQYTFPIKEKHLINLGAVYSLGHDLNGKGFLIKERYAANGYVPEQQIDTIKNAFELPHTFGVGLTYVYDNRLTVGFDYTYQKWQSVKFFNRPNQFTNRSRYSIGAEYQPNPYNRNYFSRIRYRVGAYYSDPYAKIDGVKGNKEYGLSFGFGLPLFQSKSILNISGQYVKVSPKVKGMLEENYLRLNIGLTFNERWFMKWKVD